MRTFSGQLNHIESFLTMESNGAVRCSFFFKYEKFSLLRFTFKDIKLNYATWESAVYGLGSSDLLANLRKQLFKTRLPRSDYKPVRK